MKKSLRLPFSLLFFIAIITLLASRSALPSFGSLPSHPTPKLNPLNSTLLNLASTLPYESDLKRSVEDLIDGNLPVRFRSVSQRTISRWRRDNHDSDSHNQVRSATYAPLRFRSPKDSQLFPEFRKALRSWIRTRYFQPEVISDLKNSVKSQLDAHYFPNGSGPVNPLYSSCAVVGNSGILLKTEYGQFIDSHEAVIRLNNARIQGYSQNVGSKTTLSFVNSNILHLCARREGCFCHPYGTNVAMIMYICQPIHFLDHLTCSKSHTAPLLITDSRFDVLCARLVKYYSMKRFVEETKKVPEEWGKYHDEKAFHYSSGMQAVILAIGMCKKVSVFGFGKSNEAKHHYHTNQKAELDLHDYGAEYALYSDLVEHPEVVPFINDSGFKVPPIVFYH